MYKIYDFNVQFDPDLFEHFSALDLNEHKHDHHLVVQEQAVGELYTSSCHSLYFRNCLQACHKYFLNYFRRLSSAVLLLCLVI